MKCAAEREADAGRTARPRGASSRPTTSGAPSADGPMRRTGDALPDEALMRKLDAAADGIYMRHHPVNWLSFVLAFLSGGIVAGVLAQSVSWYVADLGSFAAVSVTWVSLMLFRVATWSREHPLLAAMHRLRYGDEADVTPLERAALNEAIVKHYLPPHERERLLPARETGPVWPS